MKGKQFAFAVVGILVGFVLGFFVSQYIQGPSVTPVSQAAAQGQGALPQGHPPIDLLEQIRGLEEHAQEHPEHADVKMQLGNAYFDLHRFEEAIKWYEQALELEPENVDVNNNLGTAYYASGNPTKSVEVLERSLALRKDDPFALQNLGWVFFATNRFEEAIRYWERLVEVHPNFENIKEVKEQLQNARAHVQGEHS